MSEHTHNERLTARIRAARAEADGAWRLMTAEAGWPRETVEQEQAELAAADEMNTAAGELFRLLDQMARERDTGPETPRRVIDRLRVVIWDMVDLGLGSAALGRVAQKYGRLVAAVEAYEEAAGERPIREDPC